MSSPYTITRSELGALRRISRQEPVREHCELCHTALSGEHAHLLQRSDRQILCACQACAVLFSHRSGNRAFLRIPRDVYALDSFILTDADWAALRLPIDLAFFVRNSPERRVIAYYPSPAGPTESLLDFDIWNDIVRNNPVLDRIEADVEALLINRTRGRYDYFVAPIDQCYKLTGLIRSHWRGFSGGDDVWREIAAFFERLRGQGPDGREASHA